MRILLADDHDLVRDALKTFIERAEPETEVLCAHSVENAIEILEANRQARPDLIILDFLMPGMQGLNGLTRVKEIASDIPVAIMSGSADRAEIQAAMQAGAAGFLPKTLSGRALVGAINLIMTGERFMPVSVYESSGEEEDGAQMAAPQPRAPVTFTKRERDVLAYLFKGFSNKEIARALDLQEVTVKLHVRGLCRKLNAKNRTQAVLNARDMGITAQIEPTTTTTTG